MPLAAGTRLGSYEILAAIGAGGMGEVYRATDTNLKRQVAIKVLPESVAANRERLARFQREAEVLAALNHPNIAQIHGLETSGGQTALVMELVEGPTLADRIARGAIPVDEALRIAKQIADALEAAHEQGIVHRDLKPANVKVRDDGTVKVLDFGLAKAIEPTTASGDISNSPTITSPAMTQAGVILGTAAYMSPEQARGKPADKRADIWAFGCVLYEMLTGQRAFPLDNVSDTLAAILRGEPAWNALPPELPRPIRTLLQRCLLKDRTQRISAVSTATFVLTEYGSLVGEAPQRRRPWSSLGYAAVGLIAGAGLSGATVWLATQPAPPRATRLLITPPAAAAVTVNGIDRGVAITPDGSRVVYVGPNANALYVRALNELDSVMMAGLGQPRGPFISPDGQWIGYFDSSTVMKRVATTGGPAVELARLDGGSRGAVWLPGDTIVFATNGSTGLQQVSLSTGGEPRILTRPDRSRGEVDHLWPEALPGGQVVLFTITSATGGLDAASIAALDLRSGAQTVILRGGYHAQYVSSGHLLYGASGALRVVAFDPVRLQTSGTPVQVVPRVTMAQQGAVEAVVAADGTLVYVPASATQVATRTLVWVDRQGNETPVAEAPARAYSYPRVSPDGKHIAVVVLDQEYGIWLWDVNRQHMTPATFEPGVDSFPAWFPDSRRLAFSSDRTGTRNVFSLLADGTGAVEQLTDSPNRKNVGAVSPDGRRVAFVEIGATGSDIMALELSGSSVMPLVQTPAEERNPAISATGWLAYEADDAGQVEIFVRPFPNVNSGRWKVSAQTGGGTRPVWAPKSRELFYFAPGGELMRVGFEPGPTWSAGAPAKLLEARYYTGAGSNVGVTYDVSPDGTRFLMIKQPRDTNATLTGTSLVVVQHFDDELRRLVPTN
jgi:serine/threonine-protein kinase